MSDEGKTVKPEEGNGNVCGRCRNEPLLNDDTPYYADTDRKVQLGYNCALADAQEKIGKSANQIERLLDEVKALDPDWSDERVRGLIAEKFEEIEIQHLPEQLFALAISVSHDARAETCLALAARVIEFATANAAPHKGDEAADNLLGELGQIEKRRTEVLRLRPPDKRQHAFGLYRAAIDLAEKSKGLERSAARRQEITKKVSGLWSGRFRGSEPAIEDETPGEATLTRALGQVFSPDDEGPDAEAAPEVEEPAVEPEFPAAEEPEVVEESAVEEETEVDATAAKPSGDNGSGPLPSSVVETGDAKPKSRRRRAAPSS